jgi:formylglycine-generating enzyme required for sulfatase activity
MTRILFALLFLATAASAADAGLPPVPELIEIPAGTFVSGSDRAERDYAYALDEAAYGNAVTRTQQWYEGESQRSLAHTEAYAIMTTPVTNAQYAAFVHATKHRAPDVDRKTWESYGLRHTYAETRRFAWRKGEPPQGREEHAVVLVNVSDAKAYARWLGKISGHVWRLPSEDEWEKAARGTDGRYFPWGNDYDPARLNSADRGPFDTTPAGSFVTGASPFGLLDAAGQVFEWTTAIDEDGKVVVKGGSWDDKGCGVCRPAARHARPPGLKHILIGFRLVRE